MSKENTILFGADGRVLAVLARPEVSSRVDGDFLVVTVRQRLHLPQKKTAPPDPPSTPEKQPG